MTPAPQTPTQLFNTALQLHQKGALQEAEALYHKVLEQDARHSESLHLLGLVRFVDKQYDEAVRLITLALEIDPEFAAAHFNLARCYEDMKLLELALASYKRALELDANNAETLFGIANVYDELLKFNEAVIWYDKALAWDPNYPEALTNRGTTLRKLRRFQESLRSHNAALTLRPNYADAYFNRGQSLVELNRTEDALKNFDFAIQLKPGFVKAMVARSAALKKLKRLNEALACLQSALDIEPTFRGGFADLFSIKTQICEWDDYEKNRDRVVALIEAGTDIPNGFYVSHVIDSRAVQFEVACKARQEMRGLETFSAYAPYVRANRNKIRVGYFSPDFKQHPVAQLVAGVFEQHDRDQFETMGFSLGMSKVDEYQTRIIQGVDEYFQVRNFSDQELLAFAREKQLDIAVDLAGYTAHARPDLFEARYAPAQVSFLGYSATTGLSSMDYIIGDSMLIPPEHQPFYTEKVAYMPHSFMPSDRTRKLASRVFQRTELDLPESGMVYCAFNKTDKLSPEVFASWMRILKAVDGSVLWLSRANPWAQENLKREAIKAGVDSSRLIYAKFLDAEEHFLRYRSADLFLDTLPYNAHTTANEALWAGLPVLTRAGDVFAGRVAASLVNAAGLAELIVESSEAYEAKAIALGRDPKEIARLKGILDATRQTCPLFDVELFTRHLEDAYRQMHERQLAGLAPDHIWVKPRV